MLDTFMKRSGITSVAINYFNNIDSNKVHIDFMVLPSSESSMIDYVQCRGSKVYIMPSITLRGFGKFRAFIKEFFAVNQYDVVHSHFNQVDGIIFPIAKKAGVKHCISHSHNTRYSNSKLKSIRNWVMCLPLKSNSDTWAACSKLAGEFLYGKSFCSSSKSLIINNAIETEKFRFNPEVRTKKRKELGFNDNQFVLGNVGSLNKQKNQAFLLRIFADLIHNNKNKQFILLIVSDGPLKNELQKLSEELAIVDKVIFLGRREDVDELFQAMDLFILPSLYEGLPVVGIEAQASGLACLFSNTITKEVDICNTDFLDITNGTKEWVDMIEKLGGYQRKDEINAIQHKGFDIKMEAEKLTNYYIKKVIG